MFVAWSEQVQPRPFHETQQVPLPADQSYVVEEKAQTSLNLSGKAV